MRVPAPGGFRSAVIVLLLLLPIAAWAEDCTVFLGEADLGPLARAPRALVVQEGAILAADAYGLTVYRADETGRLGAVAEVEIEGGCFALGTMYSFLVAPGRGQTAWINVWNPDDPQFYGTNPPDTSSNRRPGAGAAVVSSRMYVLDTGGILRYRPLPGKAKGGREYPIALGGTGYGLVSDGTLLYAALGDAGLAIVRPGDAFTVVGRLETGATVRGVAVSGTLAVLSSGDALVTVDISDPATPSILGSVDLGSSARGVVLSGGTAWVADGPGGLVAVDVSDPAAPAVVHRIAVPGDARCLAFADGGTTLAVGSGDLLGADGGVGLVTVPDSGPPTLGSWLGTGGRPLGISVAGRTAFVHCGGRFEVWDLADPAAPERIASLALPATGGFDRADLTGYVPSAVGATVLVPLADAGLAVVDVSNPAAPSLVRILDTPGNVAAIAVSGGLGVVADGAGGLRVLDLSDPVHPVETGTLALSPGPVAVAADGASAWAVLEDGRVAVVDLTEPGSPALVRTFPLPDGRRALNLAVAPRRGVLLVVSDERPASTELWYGAYTLDSLTAPAPPEPSSVWTNFWFNGLPGMLEARMDAAFASEAVFAIEPGPSIVIRDRLDAGYRYGISAGPEPGRSLLWYLTGHRLGSWNVRCVSCGGTTLTAQPSSIVTDGATADVVLRASDLLGSPLAGLDPSLTTTLGTVGPFEEQGAGRYHSTLTSGAVTGTATLEAQPGGSAALTCTWQTQVQVTCADPAAVPGPPGLSLEPDGILVTWPPAQGAARYRIRRGTATVADVSAEQARFLDTSTGPGGRYCYAVASVDRCGDATDFSPPACITTPGPPRGCLSWTGSLAMGPDTMDQAKDAAFVGSRVVFASDEGVSVWDVDGTGQPRRRGFWWSPIAVRRVVPGPGATVVADRSAAGITILDISRPEDPVAVATVPSTLVPGMEVEASAGHRVALLNRGSLAILDLSDPFHPALAGRWNPDGTLEACDLENDFAVAAWRPDQGTGTLLTVLDLSGEDPRPVGSLALPEGVRVWDLAVEDGTAALLGPDASGGPRHLVLVDVSNPAAPALLASVALDGSPYEVALGDGVLWLREGSSVRVFDVSDPAAPVEGVDVAVSGDVWCLAARGVTALGYANSAGMFRIDGSDPSAAALEIGPAPGYATDLAVDGRLLLVAHGGGGVLVYDITDPSAPIRRATVATRDPAQSVDALDGFATVGEAGPHAEVIDLSVPDSPSVVANITDPSLRWTGIVTMGQGRTAISDLVRGRLAVADTTDPAAPVFLGSTGGFVTAGMHIEDGILVAPKVWSLDFLDITSMPPTTVASVRLPAPGGAVYASDYEGRQAILGLWGNASYGRLYAVSTDPPDHPLLMGQVTMGSGITAVASLGSAALAGFADGTIAKVDFSDPGTPIVGTPRPAGGAPYDILVDGDVAYVATGLQIRIASLECGPPQAGFDVTAWNLRVRLEDRTVHGADRWRWTLGDGTHASGAVVEHVFPHPGLYTVSLAIANGYGHDTVRRTLAIGGDVDWNGRVEGADAAMELAEIWDGDGISPGTAARGAHAGRPDYDLDGDGVIGASDLAWIVIMAGVSGE